jgi:hypothetical protein
MIDESAIARVSLEGRSWAMADVGLYSFEALVDGKGAEVRIAEEIAFDWLGAWTMSRQTCLEILQLHRADLAKSLERKLLAIGFPDPRGLYFLNLDDIERQNPVQRDRQRAPHSEAILIDTVTAAESGAIDGAMNGRSSHASPKR